MPEPQETWDPTGPVKRKSQFSIRNLFLWTTIVSVGVVITTASSQRVAADFGGGLGPVEQGFLVGIVLSIYIMAVCGLWTFIENPTSFYFWFPAGMSVFLPILVLLLAGISLPPGQNDRVLEILSIINLWLGVPYGVGLLVLITRKTLKRGFSLAMLLFYVVCWLWWMACAAVVRPM